MKSPTLSPIQESLGVKSSHPDPLSGAAGMQVVKVELVMLRRLVPPPEKRQEPLAPFERQIIFAYDTVRYESIPLEKKAEGVAARVESPKPSP